MEYVRSNRGAFKLIHGNHVYVKQKVLKNGAVCWECEQRRNKVACKAKLHVLNAFVPEADVIDAFEAVSEDFPLDAQAVIDYFEDTYIGRLRPGGHRRAPLFDMELWNRPASNGAQFVPIGIPIT